MILNRTFRCFTVIFHNYKCASNRQCLVYPQVIYMYENVIHDNIRGILYCQTPLMPPCSKDRSVNLANVLFHRGSIWKIVDSGAIEWFHYGNRLYCDKPQTNVPSRRLYAAIVKSTIVFRYAHMYHKFLIMGQVTKLWLSCYLVLLSVDSKTREQDSHSFVTWPIFWNLQKKKTISVF